MKTALALLVVACRIVEVGTMASAILWCKARRWCGMLRHLADPWPVAPLSLGAVFAGGARIASFSRLLAAKPAEHK